MLPKIEPHPNGSTVRVSDPHGWYYQCTPREARQMAEVLLKAAYEVDGEAVEIDLDELSVTAVEESSQGDSREEEEISNEQ